MTKRFGVGLFLLFLTLAAFGDQSIVDQSLSDQLGMNPHELFTPKPTDLSISYLGMIFGTVGSVLQGIGGQFIGEIFKVFNLGLLVFAGSFVSYTAVTTVINASQDGGPAGSKANPWVPVRLVSGVSLLIPMYSGYSMIQVIVMWAVVQGVGLADTMWTEALDIIKGSGGAVFSAPVNKDFSATKTLLGTAQTSKAQVIAINDGATVNASTLMYSALCLVTQEKQSQVIARGNAAKSGASFSVVRSGDFVMRTGTECRRPQSEDAQNKAFDKNTFCFGSAMQPYMCGRFAVGTSLPTGSAFDGPSLTRRARQANFAMATQILDETRELFNQAYGKIKQNSQRSVPLNSGLDELIKCKDSDLTTSINGDCKGATYLISGAGQFYGLIKPMLVQVKKLDPKMAWTINADEAGWVAAGSHYHDLVGQQNKPPPNIDVSKLANTQAKAVHSIDFNPNSSVAGYPLDTNVKTAYQSIFNGIGISANGYKSFIDFGKKIMDLKQSVVTMSSTPLAVAVVQPNKSSCYANISSSSLSPSLVGPVGIIVSQVLQTFLYDVSDTYGTGAFQAKSNLFGDVPLNIASNNIQVMMAYIMGDLVGLNLLRDKAWDTGEGGWRFALKQTFYCGDGATKAACSDVTPSQDVIDNMNNVAIFLGAMLSCDSTSASKAVISNGSAMNACLAKENSIKALQGVQACTNSVMKSVAGKCATTAVDYHCVQKGEGIVGSMIARSTGTRVDPLLNLASLGLTMLGSSTSYWIETTNGTYKIAKKLLTGYTTSMTTATIVGGLFTGIPLIGGLANTVVGVLTTIFKMMFSFDMQSLAVFLPFGATMAGVFFTLGIMLGVYIPLIPFLIYLFTVIGWLIAVIEAMVAAPLVALGITHPQGHDLLGKSEQAVILLLGIFIRPAAILLGFIFAITLMYIAAGMVNYGFITMIAQYLSAKISSIPNANASLIKSIIVGGMLIAYAYIMMSVVNQVFGLIYQVPEKLLRWIGSAPEQSGVGQMLGEVKQGVGSAGQQMGQGAQQRAGQAPSVGSPTSSGLKAKDFGIKPSSGSSGSPTSGGGGDAPPPEVPPVPPV